MSDIVVGNLQASFHSVFKHLIPFYYPILQTLTVDGWLGQDHQNIKERVSTRNTSNTKASALKSLNNKSTVLLQNTMGYKKKKNHQNPQQ